jgi:predicted transcriptional regulator
MPKEAVFTMKLEPELRDAFMAEAAKIDRPASQIVRELMKEFIDRREEEERSYVEFLRRKVEKSRRSYEAGHFYTNDEVNEHMKQLTAELSRKHGGGAL